MVCKCRTVSRLYVQKKHIIKKSSLFLRRVHYLLTSCTICLRGHHVYKKTFELVNLYEAARNWPTKTLYDTPNILYKSFYSQCEKQLNFTFRVPPIISSEKNDLCLGGLFLADNSRIEVECFLYISKLP